MHWLVRGAAPNDSLFFHCTLASIIGLSKLLIDNQDSGHGGQTKDLDGDEADGYDEGQCLGHYWDTSDSTCVTVIYPVCQKFFHII
jgi:hypothetical protein